jgi:type 1 glutamine amidotransferase
MDSCRRVVVSSCVPQAGALGVLLFFALGCGSGDSTTPAPPTTPTPPPTPSARVLVVTHTEGFRHDSIPAAETAISAIGTESGLFTTDFCRNADEVRRLLTADALAPYQGVVFANTTGNLPIPDLAAFLAWIARGAGFIGIHSASDTYHDQPTYLAMLGGEFTTHGAIVDAEVRVDDASHPSVSHLAPTFRIADEFYRFQRLDPGRRTLLSLARDPGDGGPPVGTGQPLAWHKNFSSGRVFYTALGHRSELWQDARYRRHVLEGIRWAIQK